MEGAHNLNEGACVVASSKDIVATRAIIGQFVERKRFPGSFVEVRSIISVSISVRAVHLITYAFSLSSSQSL